MVPFSVTLSANRSQQVFRSLKSFVSRGQLVLGKKDSVGRSLPVLGADFQVVRVMESMLPSLRIQSLA